MAAWHGMAWPPLIDAQTGPVTGRRSPARGCLLALRGWRLSTPWLLLLLACWATAARSSPSSACRRTCWNRGDHSAPLSWGRELSRITGQDQKTAGGRVGVSSSLRERRLRADGRASLGFPAWSGTDRHRYLQAGPAEICRLGIGIKAVLLWIFRGCCRSAAQAPLVYCVECCVPFHSPLHDVWGILAEPRWFWGEPLPGEAEKAWRGLERTGLETGSTGNLQERAGGRGANNWRAMRFGKMKGTKAPD